MVLGSPLHSSLLCIHAQGDTTASRCSRPLSVHLQPRPLPALADSQPTANLTCALRSIIVSNLLHPNKTLEQIYSFPLLNELYFKPKKSMSHPTHHPVLQTMSKIQPFFYHLYQNRTRNIAMAHLVSLHFPLYSSISLLSVQQPEWAFRNTCKPHYLYHSISQPQAQ